MRSFAGGEWAHAAIMAGWQAGQAANDRYRKTEKNNTAWDIQSMKQSRQGKNVMQSVLNSAIENLEMQSAAKEGALS